MNERLGELTNGNNEPFSPYETQVDEGAQNFAGTDMQEEFTPMEGGSAESMEELGISPEEFAAIQEIVTDTEEMRRMASESDASRSVRASVLANALLVADQQEQVDEAQKIIAEKGSQGFAEWVSKQGKGVVAAIALTLGLGGFAQNASAGGLDDFLKAFNNPTAQKTVSRMGEGLNTTNRLAEIERSKQSIRYQINSLVQQRELLIAQSGSRSRVENIENSVDSQVRPMEIEANYKSQKAQWELRKEQSKSRFAGMPNPTGADIARYDAEQANIASGIARINGEYQKNMAREDARSSVYTAQSNINAANVDSQIRNLDMQISRMETQIQNLDFERVRVMQQAGQVMRR